MIAGLKLSVLNCSMGVLQCTAQPSMSGALTLSFHLKGILFTLAVVSAIINIFHLVNLMLHYLDKIFGLETEMIMLIETATLFRY